MKQSEIKHKYNNDNPLHLKNKIKGSFWYWSFGLGSLIWLLLRSGTKLRRLAYPCQRAALLSSLGFVGYLISIAGSTLVYRRLRQNVTVPNLLLFTVAILVTSGITSSIALPAEQILAGPTLPAWTSGSAVSNVFAVTDVPVPQCSLDGGTIPGSGSCSDPAIAFSDEGIDDLINLMEASPEDYFYKTTAHPNGIVGADDVVVIKINNQWGENGNRLATNTDLLKGLIWRILKHPETFSGEIVIAENTQPHLSTADWDTSPANAENTNQSFQSVVDAFHSQGYSNRVSLYNWSDLNTTRINGGNIGNSGYPTGEYANGNTTDAYIMLEDPAKPATNEYSYPKFRTANGNYVSMRYGVWNNSSYDRDQLTFINMPVLKVHGMAGATAAWKNLIGFVSTDGFGTNRYSDWNTMHDYYWGFTTGDTYGLIGREIALISPPDLHLVDAIWVATVSNYNDNTAVRQNVVLASTDPFAVDWYASEYVLLPITNGNTTAARSSTFRDATRINENAARLVWPGGSFPYIDITDADPSSPLTAEKNQMNVYVNSYNNTAPTAIEDSATTNEGVAKIIDVLDNDSASSGRTLNPASVSITDTPDHGGATPHTNGTITYTPTAGFSGIDTFIYQVCDYQPECDTATVTVTVNKVVLLSSVTISSSPSQGATIIGTTFTASVTPISATTPITYIWQATDKNTITHTGRGISDEATFTWIVTGTKYVTVTVDNGMGAPVENHRSIVISPAKQFYLPLVLKN